MVTAGALAVTGESLLRGAVTAGALNVTGDSILQGMVTAGALAVTGESILHGAVTAGGLYVTGATLLADNVTINDGNFNVTSGHIIFNTVDVTPSLGDIWREQNFTTGSNPVTAGTAITGFQFANSVVRSFDSLVSVQIDATTDLFACYNLRGVQKGTGGEWVINAAYVGDNTGVVFSIDSTGQVLFKCETTHVGHSLTTINFRAMTTSWNLVEYTN
jgi:hypothetical protein